MNWAFLGRRFGSHKIFTALFGAKDPARANQATRHNFMPAVEEFEGRITPTGVTAAYVGLDYQTFLGRNGSPSEIMGWVNSGLTARQVALDFVDSPEYRTDVVNQLYQDYLTTAPTQAQLNSALQTLASPGGTFEVVTAQQILTSQAYYNLNAPSNAAWVMALYEQVLGRTPGTGEVGGWVTVLGSNTRLTVADDFLGSAEYRADLINRMYEGLVDRQPTSTELAAALAQPADDQNLATIATNNPTELRGLGAPAIFDAGTPSGTGSATTADDTAYVTGLYQKLLNRVPSTGEVAGWVAALEAGATRVQVATDFATSTEYRQDAVVALYQHFLNTNPTQAQLTSALQTLAAGGTFEQIGEGIVTSPAYYALHGPSNAVWLNALYHDCLGRSPSPPEVQGWQNFISGGATRVNVAIGFFTSAEYQTRFVDRVFTLIYNRAPTSTELTFCLGLPSDVVCIAYVCAGITTGASTSTGVTSTSPTSDGGGIIGGSTGSTGDTGGTSTGGTSTGGTSTGGTSTGGTSTGGTSTGGTSTGGTSTGGTSTGGTSTGGGSTGEGSTGGTSTGGTSTGD